MASVWRSVTRSITRLNGQLTIGNAEGGGCIVTIRLPMLNPTVQEP